jgi:hypothetical protein
MFEVSVRRLSVAGEAKLFPPSLETCLCAFAFPSFSRLTNGEKFSISNSSIRSLHSADKNRINILSCHSNMNDDYLDGLER